jgi:hypothetical protein
MSGSRADIFISYAHNDNRGSNWVSAFARQLDFALTRRLGRKPALFLDDQRLAGNETERVFEREAAAARLFVPILSPSFVERRDGQDLSWPLRELSAFLTQPGALDRVYPVEFLPLPDARLPPALNQKIRKHRFWQSLPEAGPDIEIPIDPVNDQRAFNLRIEELAARLARHLADLASAALPPADPAPGRAAGQPADGGGPAAPGARHKAVLLGQVTFDLEDELARLRSYLEQFGFRVLPEDTLPQGGPEFAAAFQAALAESALFIQLLGPHGDRRPKDLPEGYTAHQWEAAGKAGLARMVWCRPDLTDDQRAAHRDAALFQTAELLACGIEEFKAAALRRIEGLTRPPAAEAPRTAALDQIFIDSDRADLDLARSIATELERRSANVFLPVFDGSPEEIARDLRESLLDCNGIIIVFGAAPPMWVRARLRFASKVGIESPGGSRKRIAVYLHPPRQQDELGVMSPNIVWVDGRSATPADALTRALGAEAGVAGA